MKEQYENLAIILAKIRYEDHQWLVCGDLKIISMILGQQGGFTKLPCYLSEFDSRDRANHWETIYPPRILRKKYPTHSSGESSKYIDSTSAHQVGYYETVCKSVAQDRRNIQIP